MKFKYNRFLYRQAIMYLVIPSDVIFIISFFITNDFSLNSILTHLSFIIGAIVLGFIIYFLIDIFNKTYIIFDKEKVIKIKNNTEELILYQNQILYAKYIRGLGFSKDSSIDIIGHVSIYYKSNQNEKIKWYDLIISKKDFKLLIKNGYLIEN